MTEFIFLYLIIGAFAGVLAGMLGIGGGVIIVPALILIFSVENIIKSDLIPVVAVASSLASIIFTSLSAMLAQNKRQAVDWSLFKQWAPIVIIGGFCSGFIAEQMPSHIFKLGISIFLLIVSIIMLSQWMPKPDRKLPAGFSRNVIGFMSGLGSGFAGIGGGNILVPLLVFFNVQMQRAAATSSALGLPIASVGAIGYAIAGWNQGSIPDFSLGYIYLPAALSIASLSILTAPLGVKIAHKLPSSTLKRLFGFLLFIVASRMIVTSFY